MKLVRARGEGFFAVADTRPCQPHSVLPGQETKFMEDKVLTIAEALPIAEQHIAEVIARSERLRRYEFDPVCFRREADRYWVFSAGSRQLQEEGRVPGAVSACVDKVDGHVWSIEEQEHYAQSLSAIRQAVTMDSANA